MRKQAKKSQIWNAIKQHIYHNLKQYIMVSLFFLVGIVLGVIFINNATQETREQIESTIITFINALKTDYQIDSINLLKSVIGNHILFACLLWFMGCTIIGIPIVYALVVAKGFSLGYTISCVLYTLGNGKGSLFCFITLFLQNILIIPCILALAVSGIKLYEAIMKDKRRENIKIEIIRHTAFSFFILVALMLAALIEVYASNSFLSLCISYF